MTETTPRPDPARPRAPFEPGPAEPDAGPRVALAARVGLVRARSLALAVALAWLAVSVSLAGAYGPVWDCVMGEYPHGEAALNALLTDSTYAETWNGDTGERPRQPHPFFDHRQRLPWYGSYPLTGIVSAASCRLFWTRLGILPALQAHDLPVAVLVALLLYVVVRATARRFGSAAAVLSAAFLVLCPRFFAHSFNNLKDVPEAVFYVLSTFALFRAITVEGPGRMRRWLVAGALCGLALAQRPNALFVPVQTALFLAGALVLRLRRGRRLSWSWGGLLAALAVFLAVYLLVSPGFWTNPLENAWFQLRYHTAFNQNVGTTESTVEHPAFAPRVSWHGVQALFGTTPPAVLLLALVGLLRRRLAGEERLFLALGVLVPVGRTLIPGMVDYDGVRHFLEALPPLAVLAGLGAAGLLDAAGRLAPGGARGALAARAALGAVLLAGPLHAVVSTHPNGVAYYNAFLGGLGGAQRRGLSDATDYWANSYWQGLAWIEEHAEPGAGVLVPIATHVARCGAPVRMPDVPILEPTDPPHDPIYLMYVTRSTGYGPLLLAFDGKREPVHEVLCQGVPVLRILRLEGEDATRAQELSRRQSRAVDETRRILRWLREHPEETQAVLRTVVDPEHEPGDQLRRLRELLPAELHDAAAEFLWAYRRDAL